MWDECRNWEVGRAGGGGLDIGRGRKRGDVDEGGG